VRLGAIALALHAPHAVGLAGLDLERNTEQIRRPLPGTRYASSGLLLESLDFGSDSHMRQVSVPGQLVPTNFDDTVAP
jgi:hypothetical protein